MNTAGRWDHMTGLLRQIFADYYVYRLPSAGVICLLLVSLLQPAPVTASDNPANSADSAAATDKTGSGGAPAPVPVPVPVPDAKSWLSQMAQAFHSRTYQGVFVYQSGRSLENFSLVHKVDEDGTERSLLLVLDGPPREVIRKGNEVAVYGQQGTAVRFGERAELPIVNSALGKGADKLSQWYDLALTGLDRVAGRMAVVIDVRPRDRYRYGYRLWLDRETALLLKSVLLDEEGLGLERLQFVMLQTAGKVPEDALSPKLDGEPHRYTVEPPEAEDQPEPKGGDWVMGWKPEGYRLVSYTTQPAMIDEKKTSVSADASTDDNNKMSEETNQEHASDVLVDVMTFSDGLSGFSVFVEPESSWMLSQPSHRFGATSAVSKVYRQGDQNYNITVVGEIPMGAAERIAVSVQPVKPSVPTVKEADD